MAKNVTVWWRTYEDGDWDYHEELYQPSSITMLLIEKLLERDLAGKAKYGTTLDRKDLTKNQWLDHMTEELLDAAGYAQCSKDEE